MKKEIGDEEIDEIDGEIGDEEIEEEIEKPRKCFIKACNKPQHQLSRYCIEHAATKSKSRRQQQWEMQNKEEIKKDLELMKERFKLEWGAVKKKRLAWQGKNKK